MFRVVCVSVMLSLPQLVTAGEVIGGLSGDGNFLNAYFTGSMTPEATSVSFTAIAAKEPVPGAVGTFEFTFISTGLLGVVDETAEPVIDSGTIVLQELPLANYEHLIFWPPLELEWLYIGEVSGDKDPPPPNGRIQNQVSVIAGGVMDLEASSTLFEILPCDPIHFQLTVHLVGTITAQEFSIMPEPTTLLLLFVSCLVSRRRFSTRVR